MRKQQLKTAKSYSKNRSTKHPSDKRNKAKIIEGEYRISPRGDGILRWREGGKFKQAKIPSKYNGQARQGDKVEARLEYVNRHQQRTLLAKVVRIVERFDPELVGTILNENGEWIFVPQNRRVFSVLGFTSIEDAQKLGNNARVLAVVVEETPAPATPRVRIMRHFGPAGDLETETEAIVYSHKLATNFSAQAQKEAKDAASKLQEICNDPHREDLTNQTIITIDPVTARDFDDALSLSRDNKGQLVLGVHIADVSAFVTPDSGLDLEARSRGTSVYFPHKSIPMLPDVLSGDVCSLREGVNRPTKSIFITYDKNGEVIGHRYSETVICSSKRLTYEQAESICEGKPESIPATICELVKEISSLALLIEARRVKQGMLQLNIPEVDILLDKDGLVTDAQPRKPLWAHKIVEMAMVEANEASASLFYKKKIPCMRRVHPRPSKEKFDLLETMVGSLGMNLAKTPSRKEIQQLLLDANEKPSSFAINTAVLRTFEQARYSAELGIHYALASDGYCHFTSPIRRYPDLLVHRTLAKHLHGNKDFDDYDTVETSSAACVITERRAEKAERELRSIVVLAHLAGEVGETFTGTVVSVMDSGLFVRHPKYLIEGMIRLPDLGDEWWDVEPRYGLVRGRTSGKTIRIGDTMNLKINRVDLARRHLDLAPANA